MLSRSSILYVCCLVGVLAPASAAGQTLVRTPTGVRRDAPHARLSQASTQPAQTAIHASTAPRQAPAARRTLVQAPEEASRPSGVWPVWYAEEEVVEAPQTFPEGVAPTEMPGEVPTHGFLDEGSEYEPIDESMVYDGPAPTASSGEWVKNGYWYSHQIATYLSRSTNSKNSIILARDLQGSLFPHDDAFLQVPLGLGFEPGLRSTIGRYIGRDYRNRDHAIEFTFLGLTHWGAAGGLTSLTGSGLFTPIDTSFSVPAFNNSATQSFGETSDFNSYELNYRIERRLARDRLVYTRDSTWIREAAPALLPAVSAGIRVANINETLSWFAEANNPLEKGSYFVQTRNTLVGPQVGLDVFFERTDWRVGIKTKAAAVVNWDAQSSQVTIVDANGDPLVPNRRESTKAHDAAFIGELSFVGVYHLRPRFAWRFSYDLMWVTNLALAQNQLTFNPALPPEISDANSLFYQGLSFGFELTR